MDGALWGGREQKQGHMCLGRLEQSELLIYHFPDYIWEKIVKFIVDKRGFNKMSQGHFHPEDDDMSCESCGALQMISPHDFVVGEIMEQTQRGYYFTTGAFCTKFTMYAMGYDFQDRRIREQQDAVRKSLTVPKPVNMGEPALRATGYYLGREIPETGEVYYPDHEERNHY